MNPHAVAFRCASLIATTGLYPRVKRHHLWLGFLLSETRTGRFVLRAVAEDADGFPPIVFWNPHRVVECRAGDDFLSCRLSSPGSLCFLC